jgi:CubicO group peptidase (beta-lactamase class C family)
VAEGTGLENRHTGEPGIESSNLSLSVPSFAVGSMQLLRSAVLVVLAGQALAAQAPANRALLVRRLDSIAESPYVEKRMTGAVAAVVRGNDTLLLKGYGQAEVEWNVAMPADAVFEIGSITKQFTAAAILQLRDAGKLSLDDEITKWIPDFPATHRITLRRMLDHTSGIKGITELPEFGAMARSMWPRDSAVALIKRQPPHFAPGEAAIYNNSAFWLLGLVVEKASGMSYEDYVEKNIFAPLGMKRSMYCNSDEVVERRAHGYGVQGGMVRRAPMNIHRWPYAAGSLCSTAGDLVTWMKALHGGKVLSKQSYAEMTSPAKLNDGTELNYGMGIGVGRDPGGRRFIGHGGAITGFNAEATWYPDADLYVVYMVNSNGNVDPGAFAAELSAEILPVKMPAFVAFTGDAAPFVGTYKGPWRGPEMSIAVTQGPQGLMLSQHGGPARPLSWVEGSTFRLGGSLLTFRRAGNGPATELRWAGGSAHYVLKRE